jgi:hypothetical protein
VGLVVLSKLRTPLCYRDVIIISSSFFFNFIIYYYYYLVFYLVRVLIFTFSKNITTILRLYRKARGRQNGIRKKQISIVARKKRFAKIVLYGERQKLFREDLFFLLPSTHAAYLFTSRCIFLRTQSNSDGDFMERMKIRSFATNNGFGLFTLAQFPCSIHCMFLKTAGLTTVSKS